MNEAFTSDTILQRSCHVVGKPIAVLKERNFSLTRFFNGNMREEKHLFSKVLAVKFGPKCTYEFVIVGNFGKKLSSHSWHDRGTLSKVFLFYCTEADF